MATGSGLYGAGFGDGTDDGSGGSGGGGGGGFDCDPCSVSEVDPGTGVTYTAYPSVAEVDGQPNLIWMIIPGKAQWLKQFFDVRDAGDQPGPHRLQPRLGDGHLEPAQRPEPGHPRPGIPPETLTQTVGAIAGGSSLSRQLADPRRHRGSVHAQRHLQLVAVALGVPVAVHGPDPDRRHPHLGGHGADHDLHGRRLRLRGRSVPHHMAVTNVADVPVYNLTVGLRLWSHPAAPISSSLINRRPPRWPNSTPARPPPSSTSWCPISAGPRPTDSIREHAGRRAALVGRRWKPIAGDHRHPGRPRRRDYPPLRPRPSRAAST